MTRAGAAVLAAVVGCATCGAVAAQGPYPPVTGADLPRLRLNHYFDSDKRYRERDFEWTFDKTGFVVRAGSGGIPADLLAKLLPPKATATEVRGKWELVERDGARWLLLTDIRAGATAGNANVTLPIYRTAPTVVRVGSPQYVFGTAR